MKIEIIKTIEEFKKLELEWERLENFEKETTIFQTFLYNYTWWETVKNLGKYELNIIIIREDNENLLGIAPLIIETEKKLFVKIRILKFMAWGDYLGILLKTNNTNTGKIINKIFETIEKLDIDKVYLTNLDINSILGRYLKKHQVYNYLMEFQVECPQVKFSSYKSFDDFKLKFLSNSVKKQRNKMIKEINYDFNFENNSINNRFIDIENIHKSLKNYLNEKNNNDKRKSSYENTEKRNFLEKFYNSSKKINNFLLTNREEIIIYDSCYIFHNRIFSWNMAHSPKYDSYNPGRVINYEIMQWGFEQNNKDLTFDFGCGGYPWKFQWTDDFTSVYKLEYNVSKNKKIKYFEKFRLIKKGIICFIKALKN